MKKQITLRLDEDIIKWFRVQGKGYHSKINDALKKHIVEALLKPKPSVINLDSDMDETNEYADRCLDKRYIPIPLRPYSKEIQLGNKK